MAEKKAVAISYCFIFLSVYFLFIAYCSLTPTWEDLTDSKMPKTQTTNSTTHAINSLSSWSGTLVVVGIICFILTIILYFFGARSMASAI